MWDFYLADALHALFAFFLLVEEFLFAGDVASVAFGDDVFADGANGFGGYIACQRRPSRRKRCQTGFAGYID